ncbi:hypothetical protein E2C01_075278 [Portunus trituberculatus]|uniref:Uncharacterized protein n=1 Tax=Portunus trituberculatus TaxID=210409 RepID=A0A5B7I5Q2_PORTR|nr:hypothetical protein [Portunus trituberculatus]
MEEARHLLATRGHVWVVVVVVGEMR